MKRKTVRDKRLKKKCVEEQAVEVDKIQIIQMEKRGAIKNGRDTNRDTENGQEAGREREIRIRSFLAVREKK